MDEKHMTMTFPDGSTITPDGVPELPPPRPRKRVMVGVLFDPATAALHDLLAEEPRTARTMVFTSTPHELRRVTRLIPRRDPFSTGSQPGVLDRIRKAGSFEEACAIRTEAFAYGSVPDGTLRKWTKAVRQKMNQKLAQQAQRQEATAKGEQAGC